MANNDSKNPNSDQNSDLVVDMGKGPVVVSSAKEAERWATNAAHAGFGKEQQGAVESSASGRIGGTVPPLSTVGNGGGGSGAATYVIGGGGDGSGAVGSATAHVPPTSTPTPIPQQCDGSHTHMDRQGVLHRCYHKCRSSITDVGFWLGVTISFPLEHFIWEKIWPFYKLTELMGL